MDREQVMRIMILVVGLLIIGVGWYGYYMSEVKLSVAVLTTISMIFTSISLILSIVKEGNTE
ncbi:hypothetical protein DN752_16885 [Echinicola strongylocentroti]|uniref:Uncharacterized protein n=1 Tax=Echinicola strongylocentroti TaxID=1795355 RepID=A0A2Z4ILS1_9BACT|nr:hypothetical protein [Echinicola strongylocentroti]AWW31667.1 hypothetical protein DN752_16885 [Echinicola strongylocentroti]